MGLYVIIDVYMYSMSHVEGSQYFHKTACVLSTGNNKKLELMLTRRGKAYSISGLVVIAENWGVYAKLIYKYQILYLDHKR